MGSPSKVAAFLVFVALVGGFAWFVSQSPRVPDDRSVVPRAEPSELVTPTPESSGVLPAQAESRAEPEPHPEPGQDEVERVAIASPPHSAGGGTADLIVRVVDRAGTPLAGVPVVLTTEPRRDGGMASGSSRGISAEDGRVVFAGERARLSERVSSAGETWWITHEVAFEEPPTQRLDAAALQLDVIESVQPPFGALEVRVLELDGSDARDIDRVELALVHPDEDTDPSRARERRRVRKECEGGRALFAHVEPGRECIARARRTGTEFASEARGAGPPRPGARARLDVHMGGDRPFLLFRALDEAGRVLADTELRCDLMHDVFFSQGQQVRSDARGEFRVELDLELASLIRPDLQVATVNEEPRRVGLWKKWRKFEDGANDCGEVVLEPEGLLVGGRVVDERGRGVVGAHVRFGNQPDYEENSFDWMHRHPERETRTDEEGRFEFRGPANDSEDSVWAFHPSHAPDGDATLAGFAMSPALPFEPGADAVELVIRSACQPQLAVLLPELPIAEAGLSVVGNLIKVRLTPAEGGAPELQRQTTSASPDSLTLVFRPAWPGRYELACFLDSEPLRTVDSLTLAPDGSLGTLDLRDAFHVHAVRMNVPDSSDDTDPLNGTFLVRPSGSDADRVAHDIEGGLAWIPSVAAAVDVELFPDGYAAEPVLGLSGYRELTLRPPLRVRFVLVTDGPLFELPYLLNPAPKVEGRSVGRAEGTRYFTDTNREVVFLLPRAGPLTVQWHLEKQIENGAIGGTALMSNTLEVEVQDAPGEQRIELHVPAKAMRELVENPPF